MDPNLEYKFSTMLHFTPLYKPLKGYRRPEKWEGDVMGKS